MSKNVGQLNVKLTADTKQLEQGVDSAVDKLQEAQGEIKKTDTSSLDNLKNTVIDVFNSIKSVIGELKNTAETANVAVDTVTDNIEQLTSTTQMLSMPLDDFKDSIKDLSKEQLTGLFDELTYEIGDSKLSVLSLKQELAGIEKTKINAGTIKELRAAINQVNLDTQDFKVRLEMVKSALNSIKDDDIQNIGSSMKDVSKSTSKLGNQMSSSFKKGINSLKRFSLGLIGVRTGLNYLVQAMKTYISSSDTMVAKTTGISQALAQSLAPYSEIAVNALQKLVHWVIVAIAYFTTFINKIFGTNIAIAGMDGSMKSLTKNTKKAAKEAKNALAPFDELNILQEGSDSEGSNYVAPDFSGLGISEDEFSGITAFGAWLDDHKEIIEWLLITITAIVAVWTLWNVAVGVFNALMSVNPIVLVLMAAIAVIALIIVYWDDFKKIALAVLDAIGSTFKSLWEDLIKPLLETIWGFIKPWIEAALNIVRVALAAIGAAFTLLFEAIKVIVSTIVDVIKVAFNLVKNIIVGVINIVIDYWKLLFSIVKSIFDGIWNVIKTIFTGIRDFISKILKGDIAGAFESLKNTIINVFQIVWNTIKKIFSNIWEFIGNIAKTIGDVFSSAIKGTVNAIIGFAEKTINGFLKAINVAIDIINAIPGVNIKRLTLLDIPRLASGTVATGPMVAEIGEYSGAKTNPEIVSPEDRIYANMVKALRETKDDRIGSAQGVELTINVKYEDGRTIIKKINTAQHEAGTTLLEV